MKIFLNEKYYRLVKDKRFIIHNNKIYKLSNLSVKPNIESSIPEECSYCGSSRLFKYGDNMLQCDICDRLMYINKPILRKRQTRYTHRRRYAGNRLYNIADKLPDTNNIEKLVYHLTILKKSKLSFNNELSKKYNNMPEDFEPIKINIKKVVYRAIANGLRFVNYLKMDHYLNNINYFDLLYLLLCYEAGEIIQARI